MARRLCFVALCGALLAGCNGAGSDPVEAGVPSGEAYTPEASSQLDAAGRFVTLAHQQAGELTSAEARAIAAAFVHDFFPSNASLWNTQHGARIGYERLRPCGRSFYAESSYEPISPDFIRPVRSAFAGWWLVTLCDGTQGVLAVGVSAIATDVSVSRGSLVRPLISGNEFVAQGIPMGKANGIEFRAPELAAGFGFARTGARIRAVPVLVAARFGRGPLNASWRLELERPVRLVGARDGNVANTDTVYVGLLGAWGDQDRGSVTPTEELIVPDMSQPAVDSAAGILSADVNSGDAPSRVTMVRASRRASVPLVFELAFKSE